MRVDKSTAQAERGQFTRLSVEIDLSKPLLSKFWLKGRIWRVQYEGIRMLCFKCGKLGHTREDCSMHIQDMNLEVVEINKQLEHTSIKDQTHHHKPEEHEEFGSWMLDKKPVRKRPTKQGNTNSGANTTANGGSKVSGKEVVQANQSGLKTGPHPHANQGENNGKGSRFAILVEQGDKEGEYNQESSKITIEQDNQEFGNTENSPPTVDLGVNSQNISFTLGNIPKHHTKSKPSIIITQTYQQKRTPVKQGSLNALFELNNNISKECVVTKILTRTTGKENSLIFGEAHTQDLEAITQSNKKHEHVIASQPFDLTHVSPTPRHPEGEDPPGKNGVCQSTNGETLLGSSDPPDPCFGGENRLIPTTNLEPTGLGGYNDAPQ